MTKTSEPGGAKERPVKDEIYFAVCNAILKMEIAKGPMKWTVSDVSRESGVTRSLIYYYFGKDKKAIVEVAYKFILSHFYNPERVKSTPLRERLAGILTDLRSMPYLMVLFYLAKGQDSEFGRMIREKEKEHLKALKSEFSHLTENQILEVYLLELGAMLYHFPPEKVNELFSLYNRKP